MSGFIELLKAILTLFVKNAKPSQADSPKKVAATTKTDPIKPKLEIQYKDPKRHLAEIEQLKVENPDLLGVLEFIRNFSQNTYNKEITVTMILRTDAEQDHLYRNSTKYKAKKFKSPHQFGHAFDLRSKTFTIQEIDALVNATNNTFNSTNFYKPTAMYHDVGSGLHFHINYVKK